MAMNKTRSGSVMLIAIFVIALLSALVTGMLQINTGEVQLMHNQISACEALAIAEAGLNDAFAQLRVNKDWTAGFSNKPLGSHKYTVKVSGKSPKLVIESTGTSAKGYVSKVTAEVATAGAGPYRIGVNSLRID